MPWETDKLPMTREKAIKLKAHAYIMMFNNLGISWKKSKEAAIAMVIELKAQYVKNYTGPPAGKQNALDALDQLEHDINAY